MLERRLQGVEAFQETAAGAGEPFLLVAIVAGLYSVTRIVAGLYPYLVRWTWPLGRVVVP